MKKIGVLFGQENSFPGSVGGAVNSMNVEGIRAEFVKVGGRGDGEAVARMR